RTVHRLALQTESRISINPVNSDSSKRDAAGGIENLKRQCRFGIENLNRTIRFRFTETVGSIGIESLKRKFQFGLLETACAYRPARPGAAPCDFNGWGLPTYLDPYRQRIGASLAFPATPLEEAPAPRCLVHGTGAGSAPANDLPNRGRRRGSFHRCSSASEICRCASAASFKMARNSEARLSNSM